MLGKNAYQYRVTSVKDLINAVIPHFNDYPLISQKHADFELFKQAVYLLKDKKHFNLDGIQKLLSIKSAINLGLSDQLKLEFPNVIPMSRPLVIDQTIKDPN
jgi:hypothetical protein